MQLQKIKNKKFGVMLANYCKSIKYTCILQITPNNQLNIREHIKMGIAYSIMATICICLYIMISVFGVMV